jgi:hypothetical protein
LTVPCSVAPTSVTSLVAATVTAGASLSVTRPMRDPPRSANHSVPFAPAAIETGSSLALMPSENSVTTPAGVMRAILCACDSVTQTLPSGPVAIPVGLPFELSPSWNSVTSPAVVMRVTVAPSDSVNQRSLSHSAQRSLAGPVVIPSGTPLRLMPASNCEISPSLVTRPTRSLPSVNHIASLPRVMSVGAASSMSPSVYVVTSPSVVIATIAGTQASTAGSGSVSNFAVIQSLPSSPSAIPLWGWTLPPRGNSVTTPCGVILPMAWPLSSTNHMPPGPAVIP